jgi:uncharacterized OsmC-like protein
VALGACGLLSADHTLASRLGDEYASRVDITAAKDIGGQRYESIAVNILANMAALDEDERDALIDRASRAIERGCTIGRTLTHGAEHDIQITTSDTLPERI